MTVIQLLERAWTLGATITVPEPGRVHLEAPSPLPDELMAQLRKHKDQVIRLLSDACTCEPLPSRADIGHFAHAGVGPDYERCATCGKTWQCKICSGCRYCRTPG